MIATTHGPDRLPEGRLHDDLRVAIANRLARATGLDFPAERWRDMRRGLRSYADEIGARDLATAASRLLSGPIDTAQTETLARHFTVGETYFWRDPALVSALREWILPELIRVSGTSRRRIKIWCAGCSTGEEAYTLAMLLERQLGSEVRARSTLLATDLNMEAIRHAREGRYGEWSFRGTPRWVVRHYFDTDVRRTHRLSRPIRECVAFDYLNLVDGRYPSPLNGTHDVDLLLCRNVLMYLQKQVATRVLMRLVSCLAPGGWLVVAPAEMSETAAQCLDVVSFEGATVYRRGRGAVSPPSPRPRRAREFPIPPTSPGLDAGDTVGTDPQARGRHMAHMARSCASRGLLDEAERWCSEAIATDKLNVGFHFLQGVIFQERGRYEDASSALKRVLYLDPEHVMAHFVLGNVAGPGRDKGAARRHLSNALALLSLLEGDEPLPDGDGITAAGLERVLVEALGTGGVDG